MANTRKEVLSDTIKNLMAQDALQNVGVDVSEDIKKIYDKLITNDDQATRIIADIDSMNIKDMTNINVDLYKSIEAINEKYGSPNKNLEGLTGELAKLELRLVLMRC